MFQGHHRHALVPKKSRAPSRAFRSPSLRRQAGITLMEVMIVLIILGLIAYIGIQKYKQAQPPFRAAAMESASRDLTEVFVHISEMCGTTADVENSPLAGGGAANTLSFLLRGTNMQAQYEACIRNSGAKFLNALAQGPTGSELVAGYRLVPSMADANHIRWAFQGVPVAVALAGYTKYSSATGAAQATTLPGSDSTDQNYQFDAPSAGTTTVYFISAI